jgi:hypothetical protein
MKGSNQCMDGRRMRKRQVKVFLLILFGKLAPQFALSPKRATRPSRRPRSRRAVREASRNARSPRSSADRPSKMARLSLKFLTDS